MPIIIQAMAGSSKLAGVKKTYIILMIIGGVALVSSLFVSFSLCPIYNITGIPCPSCGMTRAFASLIAGNFGIAFWEHPLFWSVPLIPLLMLEKLPKKLNGALLITLIGLFAAVWIVRMVLFFPDVSPMVYNENSLFEFLRGLLRSN